MRFCIINDKDNIIIKKERSNNMFDQKSLNKIAINLNYSPKKNIIFKFIHSGNKIKIF